jgi:hypothetical protein
MRISKLERKGAIGAFVVGLLFFVSQSGEGEVQLAEEGGARAVIVLPAKAHQDEVLAAAEIREHLRLMTGADMRIVSGEAPGGCAD